jgi:hypothetical protein
VKNKEVCLYIKLKVLLLVLILNLGVTASALATDSYLCIGGKMTRFIYDKNTEKYRPVIKESYNIYIVEKYNNAKYDWQLRKTREGDMTYFCEEAADEPSYITCDYVGDFKLFKHNLKFLISDYVHETADARGYVRYIEIGRCHPFN